MKIVTLALALLLIPATARAGLFPETVTRKALDHGKSAKDHAPKQPARRAKAREYIPGC